MTPNRQTPMHNQLARREFLAGTVMGLPFLVTASAATAAQTNDEVLNQILADAREIASEKRNSRKEAKAAFRAIEQNLGMMAAYASSRQFDQTLKTALRKHIDRRGRATLLNDMIVRLEQHKVDRPLVIDDADRAISDMLRRGVTPLLRKLKQSARRYRDTLPDEPFQHVRAQTGYDYCADMRRNIEMLEWNMVAWCALGLAEPTPVGETICGFLTATWLTWQANYWFWCG